MDTQPQVAVTNHVVPESPFTEEFKAHVVKTLEEWRCPGMSMAVIEDQDIFTESFGYAKFPDTKATNETVWYNGSCTKSYTGALLAKMMDNKAQYPALADKGWATTMVSVIRDDFVLQDEWAMNHVTIRDASCHQTGMNRHDLAMLKQTAGNDGVARPTTLRDHVRQMRYLKMGDEPRTRFIYSNHMYMALSHLIETVTGKSLGDAFREHIWNPLGMKSTYLGNAEADAGPETVASGYSWNEDTGSYEPLPAEAVTEFRGTGAVISTVADAAKWLRCLATQSGDVFSPAVHAEIATPRIIMTAVARNGSDIVAYGLSWSRTVYKGKVLYSHGGGTMSQGYEMYWMPELRFGFVAAGNAHRVSNLSAMSLAYKLIDEKLGVPEGERKDFSAMLHAQEGAQKEVKDSAMTDLFPGRPDPPLPSPIKTSELVGSYRDAGYGTLVFAEVPHPDQEKAKGGETILQAERRDAMVPMRVRLVHATASHWLVYMKPVDDQEDALSLTMRAEFTLTMEGKPAALELDFTNPMLGVNDGKVVFKRV